jgi:uncharacterized membrane protein YjjB (DUF3815 family)
MFGALLYGKLRTRLGAARTAAVGGVLQGISILLPAVTQSVLSIALGSILLGFGGGLLSHHWLGAHAIRRKTLIG